MSYLFEQAGRQMQLSQTGYWLASAPEDELRQMVAQDPEILKAIGKEILYYSNKINKINHFNMTQERFIHPVPPVDNRHPIRIARKCHECIDMPIVLPYLIDNLLLDRQLTLVAYTVLCSKLLIRRDELLS